MASKAAQDIFAQIQALPIPDQIRLAAALLEQRKADTAYAILNKVTTELGAALAVRAIDARKDKP